MKFLSYFFALMCLVFLHQCVEFDPIECSSDVSCDDKPCVGYDSDVDSVGQKYIPGELVLDFTEAASAGVVKFTSEALDDINDDLGSTLTPAEKATAVIDSCLCDKNLFLYKNPAIIGKEAEVASKAKKGKTGGEGDVLLNYLIQNDNEDIPSFIVSSNSENNSSLSNKVNSGSGSKIMAILDSGIDANVLPSNSIYQDISTNLCLTDSDPFGWNFVSDNNQLLDDNGHGTFVALSYFDALDALLEVGAGDQQLLTVKILNECGEGTVFNAACGLYYAVEKGADVINNSWGLYAPCALLDRVFMDISSQTKNVCSAGNQTENLASKTHIPSEYSLSYPSVFEVGSLCKNLDKNCGTEVNLLLLSSNFRDGMMIEDGRNVQSLHPAFSLPCSVSGTSFAAPRVSAGLIRELEAGNNPDNRTFTSSTYKLPLFNYYSYVREHCR